MNIASILNKIKLFEELVIESGFKRDAVDYSQSIRQSQNQNLTFMKELSQKVKLKFEYFENNALDNEISIVLKDSTPFTSQGTMEKLVKLDEDPEIDAPQYFQQFNQILNSLNSTISSNEEEMSSIKEVFSKYVTTEVVEDTGEQAIMSIVFKDLETTTSLKEFSRVLNRWNRILTVYHRLLKSDSPEEIALVEIQNGSIDVVFNIDVDVAVDLVELLKIALKAYGMYLLYKSRLAKEIIESYLGNKDLIAQEEEREALMLGNIKESVKKKIKEQHKEKLKQDKDIDKTSLDVKVNDVADTITDHVIRGNEVRLLSEISQETDEESDGDSTDLSTELREETSTVRERFKKISEEDKQLLLDKYKIDEDEEKEKK